MKHKKLVIEGVSHRGREGGPRTIGDKMRQKNSN